MKITKSLKFGEIINSEQNRIEVFFIEFLFLISLTIMDLCTQGAPWDAQKDMALATVGALAALVVAAVVRRLR